jgi:hypothetical protein
MEFQAESHFWEELRLADGERSFRRQTSVADDLVQAFKDVGKLLG